MVAEHPHRRLFESALLLLLLNGFLAVWLNGGLDPVTAIVHVLALIGRTLMLTGRLRTALSRPAASALAIGFVLFYPADILWISGDFVVATVRMMFLFASLKLLIAERSRDFVYLGLLAFLELLTASVFTAGPSFLVSLGLFLFLACLTAAAWQLQSGYEGSPRVIAAPSGRRLGAALARWAVGLAAGILLLTSGLFAVLPRPYSSNGGFSDRHRVGFSSEVNLGLTGALDPDPRPVMRVQPLAGSDVRNLRWRGVALYRFDGMRWSAPSSRLRELSSRGAGYAARLGHERRADEGKRLEYRVTQEPLETDALFLAGQPERISGLFSRLLMNDEGVFRAPEGRGGSMRYEVVAWLPDPSRLRPNDVIELFSREFQSDYLDLPDLDPRIGELARQIVGDARSPLERARLLEEYLKTQFDYTLDLPAERAADPVANFLFERRKGHCEYFATSMALMLRTLGIPSRIVSGFAGGVSNPLTGMLVLRSSDAHSWVEAYIPGYGWLEFDATPTAGVFDRAISASGLWMYWDAFQSTWLEWVVDYDTRRQVEIAIALQEGSREAVFEAVDLWLTLETQWDRLRNPDAWPSLDAVAWNNRSKAALGALALLLLVPWAAPRLRRLLMRRRLERGRAAETASSYFYELALRALERRGFRRKPWQSAEEFAASIPDERLRALAAAVAEAYSAARFGGDAAAERALPQAVRALERA
ncbi:MAG: DUF3488 domain-containing protein [Acidobacteria bacterium]|nr:DUF3488 domain-containing protein [Acidobacteriota bacterium]